MRPRPLYVIKYYQDQGKFLIETIGKDLPMSRLKARNTLAQLRRTTHKTGVLIIERANKFLNHQKQ
jgi:hypothetical protein